MPEFMKGLNLCQSFFQELVMPIISNNYPILEYSAGLLGYGSDVLGYDDYVSTDHMWGPRLYLFINESDIELKGGLMKSFESSLPYEYKGYSINFSTPDSNDNGVRHPEFINSGEVSPLIWIYTIKEFINEYLGLYPTENIDWLSLSEHRLLGFTSGKLFVDMLDLSAIRKELSFYPDDVKLYLIASQWAMIAEEQAFVKRCSDCQDELGSKIVCSRIVERLMRLCFLYMNTYAPYSKWFGTGFKRLLLDEEIKNELNLAVRADSIEQRESSLVNAQALVAKLHNDLQITSKFEIRIQKYYDRNIKVIFTDKLAEMVKSKIVDEDLKKCPLIGSLSQIGNFVELSDNPRYILNIQNVYKLHR